MASVRLYHKKNYTTKTGVYPVYASFYIHGEKIDMSTKVSVHERSWDGNKQRVKPSDSEYQDKNLIIYNVKARINNVMVKYRLRDMKLTKEVFLREYSRKGDFENFFDFVRDYQRRNSNEIEFSTLKTHITAMKKLEDHSPNLHFDDITLEFITQYYWYLKKKLKNEISTTYKNMSVLKKYVRKACRAGYMLTNPFEEFPIKRCSGRVVFLTEKELDTLVDCYNAQDLPLVYHSTLRFFLFMCFTSLHITDAKSLRVEQIGKDSFTYYRVKNRNSKPAPIVVPISVPARKLLGEVVGSRSSGLIFEKLLADQKINEYLKKIAEFCAINKPISAKAGRHTFATIYLRKTKDITALKEILGHSDMRETLIYAHVLEESKIEGIKAFDGFAIE